MAGLFILEENMKVIIEPGEAPKIYDDNGKRIKGIFSFDYNYITCDTDNAGRNSMRLNHYSKQSSRRLSLLHKGWDLNE